MKLQIATAAACNTTSPSPISAPHLGPSKIQPQQAPLTSWHDSMPPLVRELYQAPGLLPEGARLIARMLCYDPSERITAAQALLHPFMTPALPLQSLLAPPFTAFTAAPGSGSVSNAHSHQGSRLEGHDRPEAVYANATTAGCGDGIPDTSRKRQADSQPQLVRPAAKRPSLQQSRAASISLPGHISHSGIVTADGRVMTHGAKGTETAAAPACLSVTPGMGLAGGKGAADGAEVTKGTATPACMEVHDPPDESLSKRPETQQVGSSSQLPQSMTLLYWHIHNCCMAVL